MTDHDCEPLDPCPVCEADKAAYDQGRADERAAIVRWLRRMGTGDPFVAALTNGIEAGEHER